jgi:CRISPR/Cas system CSM-associated protein Csm3 (group 7 of RAMP superfamily)
MLKKFVNEFQAVLKIVPKGPILIKSGQSVSAGTDMSFVKTYRNDRPEVYLPGSSLKGVIRTQAERIGRTLKEEAVCNLFNSSYTNLPGRNPSPWGVPACSVAFACLER